MKFFCFDVETTGLQFGVDKIIAFAINNNSEVNYYSPDNIGIAGYDSFHKYACDFITKELVKCTNNDTIVFNHNIKFDLRMVDANPDLVDQLNIFDTTILYHYINPRNKKALGDIEIDLYGSDKKSTLVDQYGKKFTEWPKSLLEKYNKYDVELTARIFNDLWNKVPDNFKRYQQELIKSIYRIEYFGFPYDHNTASKVQKEFEELKNRKLKEIKECLKEYGINSDTINFNSSKQLSELIYEKLNLPKPDRNYFPPGKGFDKLFTSTLTNKDLLKTIHHPFISLYLDLSSIQSTLTFIKSYEKLQISNRLYPSFNITGTITGRLSCSKPNLQNIKKKSVDQFSPRSLFVPEKNETLVSIDYQQQEIRMLAVLSQDPNLLELVNLGIDMHSAVGCKMWDKPELTKEERDVFKNLHFG